ncbi:cyclic nucleotide-binding domain-containing protein [Hydrogenovibrio marinus]|uniref:Crp/Fnr family transcriptional regulator n=1 Tax=Hydrogenovibrio marinus TaxID=28885 RepID=A0A066ZNX2_HYDMR|nr:cyclic nucleotide-binding domain-containing protein [Hydrogenovibrio marinus]KDN95523.1 Crp/Fnr family transcriptional regulator [Hydrogenovibrio marinus]BBN60015.1 fumarate and nitrate reduction regulatory protein [Hydrogenovibrio marinus]
MGNIAIHYTANCANCGLQRICFANGLHDTDLSQLDELVNRKPSLSKGEYLFKEGEKFTSLFAVRAGAVKLFSYDHNNLEVIHGFYLPGDIVGMDSIAYQEYQFYAVALDVTTVCEIPYGQLSDLATQVPNLYSQIFSLMSQEIVGSRMYTSLLTQKTAEQRLAYFIWSMSLKYKSRGYLHTKFRLNILHRDVASYLNLTPETVSRILAKFNKLNVLNWKKKEITILNEEHLKEFAGEDALICSE